jgi:hypothetical protein
MTYLGSKRLALQCRPTDPKRAFAGLQDLIHVDIDDLHLTILHIGKSLELYNEVNSATGLDLRSFEDSLVGFLLSCTSGEIGERFHCELSDVSELSSGEQSYLVAGVIPSPELRGAREKCRRGFLHLLSDFGIVDPEGFMEESDTIAQHSSSWLPHITLASGREYSSVSVVGSIGRMIEVRRVLRRFP